jgi:hypothetical protein
MLSRVASIALCGCLCLAAWFSGPHAARAVEIQCLEPSKYKYLYLIFGNDRRKFAQHLRVSEAGLPDGEACRAVLVTGRIESRARSTELGQSPDYDKLMHAVAESHGWLATVYFASPGGSIGTGLVTAVMTRLFWLKSEAPNDRSFIYWPDFITRPAVKSGGPEPALTEAVVPPELAEGWKAYIRAVASFAKTTLADKGRCASACTFSHVSAIERRGIVFVHRGSASPSVSDDKSMQEILESLHRVENRIVALYRSMDGGEEFVRLFQSTPAATVNPAVAARYPRYISDLLRTRCKGDSDQLLEQELRIGAQIDDAAARSPDPSVLDRLKAERSTLQAKRGAVEQCAAASHEKERLTQFAKFCSSSCNRALIVSTVNAKLEELGPSGAEQRNRK